jgi:citrate synthase
MAQIAHVTPDEFRLIAPHVSEEGLRFDGGVIAFLPENSEKVANAAAVLLEQEKPTKEKAALSFAAMVKRCDALTEAVERMARELEPVEQMKLTISISRLRRAAARKGANTL